MIVAAGLRLPLVSTSVSRFHWVSCMLHTQRWAARRVLAGSSHGSFLAVQRDQAKPLGMQGLFDAYAGRRRPIS